MQKFFFLLMFFAPVSMFAQHFQMNVELNSAAGKDVYLANYYLGNIYVKDTVRLGDAGKGVFEADSLLPQGLYKIYLDENHHFDFLLGVNQQFTIKNESFYSKTVRVAGSEETAAFVDYTNFLSELQQKGAEISKASKAASGQEREKIQEEIAGLTTQLHNYWDSIALVLPGSFLEKFVRANYVPPLDISMLPEEVQHNDSLLLIARFYHQQKHFWDNFDYTDERFLYTPFFKKKLETWFTKVLYQNYDSVRNHVSSFIEEVKPQPRIFQFATSFFLNASINSNIMGMDALFVDIAREYYLSGQAFWASEESLEKIRENVLFAENNLIGKTAPDLTLESFDGEYVNLHQTEAKYTLVLIYEPNCSHCREFVPELYSKVFQPYKNKGLAVFAIYSDDNKDEWGEFLAEHNMFDWTNVWDQHHTSRFKVLYDGRITPGIYVLDENKTIVAKKITVEYLEAFMEAKLGAN
ncbi:Peroxiredoxin [Mariniphaga anaerophila]|uniref:Peroxiredoxin n=1 Tax=Mariniphaga anaerophila TaxID=1484053 RepID=A0A1M4XX36_9BACT|nr:redoxin domain-containing protein [Mariniphaga anaerophila]SHE98127.1 Peroxiredoxin [Mariniphaga anaerophila]